MDKAHYGNPIEQRPQMAQRLIDIAADDPKKQHEYGIPISLDKFGNLITDTQHPSAAAAKLKSLPADDIDPTILTAIYEPDDGYKNSNIMNIKISLDIFGPSTTEIIRIDKRHPTFGFEFESRQQTAQPIIQSCKSGTQAAKLRSWQSRFQHGTIRAITGK